METEGRYNYPETNTSALCTPSIPLSQAWQRKTNASHILGERHSGVAEEHYEDNETGGNGGEKILKGMEKDESRKKGMGEDRDGERHGCNEGKGGGDLHHSMLVVRHQNVHPLLAY